MRYFFMLGGGDYVTDYTANVKHDGRAEQGPEFVVTVTALREDFGYYATRAQPCDLELPPWLRARIEADILEDDSAVQEILGAYRREQAPARYAPSNQTEQSA